MGDALIMTCFNSFIIFMTRFLFNTYFEEQIISSSKFNYSLRTCKANKSKKVW